MRRWQRVEGITVWGCWLCDMPTRLRWN